MHWRMPKAVNKRKFRSVARLAVAGALAVFFGLTVLDREQSRTNAETTVVVAPAADSTDSRPFYRHSVVRGGVYSDTEAQTAAGRDGVVRTHYRDVNLRKLTPVVLDRSVDRYVSFRRNDRIYWTSRRMRVPKGEILLSDGESLVRARCGNRLSETPQDPTVPRGVEEPTDDELSSVEPLGQPERISDSGTTQVDHGTSVTTQTSDAGLPAALAIAPAAGSPSTVAEIQDESQAISPEAGMGGGYGPASAAGLITSASTLTASLPPADIPQFGSTRPEPVVNPTVGVIPVLAVNIIPAQPAPPVAPVTSTPAGATNPTSNQPGTTSPSTTAPVASQNSSGSQNSTSSQIPRGGALVVIPSGSVLVTSALQELPLPEQQTPEPGTFLVCALGLAAAVIQRKWQS